MHKFHPLPPISDICVFAMALPTSIAFVTEPRHANKLQVRLNDSKDHSARRNVQRAHCRAGAGG